MALFKFRAMLIGAALLLPACSMDNEALWPSLDAPDPSEEQAEESSGAEAPQQAQAPRAQPRPQAQQQQQLTPLRFGESNFEPTGVTPGIETGTFVGKKVVELREELRRLQLSISTHNKQLQDLRVRMVQNSQRYHGTVAAIQTRLQVGTTPGNPILVQQYHSAQMELDKFAADTAEMNKLIATVAEDATMASFLSESSHAAFNVSGAVDEDHRQLAILEDEVNRTVVLIDRLYKEASEDMRRQSKYLAYERSNLNVLSAGIKTGESFGVSLVNRALASTAGVAEAGPGHPRAIDTTGRRPLVKIVFDRPDVTYDKALYNAVSKVLDRRPDAVFDLVAVAPSSGSPAKVALNANKARQHAQRVLTSLLQMGLPANRVSLSAKTNSTAGANEVHLYLR